MAALSSTTQLPRPHFFHEHLPISHLNSKTSLLSTPKAIPRITISTDQNPVQRYELVYFGLFIVAVQVINIYFCSFFVLLFDCRECSLAFLKPLQAVLFDIDGTLCDSDPIHYHAFRDMLQAVSLNFIYMCIYIYVHILIIK